MDYGWDSGYSISHLSLIVQEQVTKANGQSLNRIRLVLLLAGVFLAACTSSPDTPAPVRSLSKNYSDYVKGEHRGTTYRVEKGQTLYSVAWHVGMDYNMLAKINGIKPPYTIHPGQVLSIKSKKNITKSAGITRPANKAVTTQKSKQKVTKTVDQKPQQDYGNSSAGQNVTAAKTEHKVSFKPDSGWIWPASGKRKRVYSSTESGIKGVDILGRFGQSVVAAAGGKVVYAGDGLRGYGQLVIIKHSQDYLSAYAHNSKIRVREGQWVKPGQRIADMGSTGTDQVKLHFEIRFRGKPVNPNKYLPK